MFGIHNAGQRVEGLFDQPWIWLLLVPLGLLFLMTRGR